MHRYLVNFNLNSLPIYQSDVLIVGGGIAGLTTALSCDKNFKITILTKTKIKEASTWYAQGGVAAAVGRDDSPQLHYEDTLKAGSYLNDPEAVRTLTTQAKQAIEMLIKLGTKFAQQNGEFLLAKEGGHSKARVLHAGDATGTVIALSLAKAVSHLPNVRLLEEVFVIDILTVDDVCLGLLAYEKKSGQKVAFLAPAVVLAAGGVGQLYKSTTNPLVATADGLALAYRAQAKLKDLEFLQFHPTALDVDENPKFLISEALRGEGAYLVTENGERFMLSRHPLAELAPRDTVSQAIASLNAAGIQVFLDARHLGAAFLKQRFPSIYNYCLKKGFNLATDLVPVKPAAHFLVGGVKINLDGATNVPGLFACGEVASVGVHGANRLASNSLLEGLVFGRRLGSYLNNHLKKQLNSKLVAEAKTKLISKSLERAVDNLEHLRQELKQLMEDSMGVIRKIKKLKKAEKRLKSWLKSLEGKEYQTPFAWETQNMLTAALLMVQAALNRKQSVGVHQIVNE